MAMRIPAANNRGVALVEFALISVLLMTLVMGILDFGTLYYYSMTLNQAVEEGARTASLGRDASVVKSVVEQGASTVPYVSRDIFCEYRQKVGGVWNEWDDKPPGSVTDFDNCQVKVWAVYQCNRLAGSFFGENPVPLTSPAVVRKME